MHVASVTLDEVLRAAAGRAAALVPETAGYLALAIGDASARLPYRIEDDLVTITSEGTVRVARGRETVSPEEGARVLRDHLRRLLTASAGSMPGLAHAGSPRSENAGPEAVIAEIEAALIPVNRAAARRSLARLARDTARARDDGRLAVAPAPPRTAPRAEARRAAAPPPPPPVAEREEEVDVFLDMEPATPFRAFAPMAAPQPEPEPEVWTRRLEMPTTAEPARPAWVSSDHLDAGELHDPTVLDPDVIAVIEALAQPPLATACAAPRSAFEEIEGVTPRLGTPAPSVVLTSASFQPADRVSEQAARSLETALRAGRLVPASPRARASAGRAPRPIWQAELGRASQSDVDSLLAAFRPSDPVEDATSMRRDLKKLVGIDATQLPPRVALRGR